MHNIYLVEQGDWIGNIGVLLSNLIIIIILYSDLHNLLIPKILCMQYKEAILAYAVLLKAEKDQVC